MDKDLQSIQEVRDLLKQAKTAQKELAAMDQGQLDRITAAVSRAGAEHARRLADQVAALPRAFRGKRLVWAHTLPHWQDALREILEEKIRLEQ